MHGRGSDQSRPDDSQSQSPQLQGLPPCSPSPDDYLSPNTPLTSPHVPPAPLSTDVQHPPPLPAIPGQYTMPPQPLLTIAHTSTPTFVYSAFRVQEQPRPMHGGYPTPASYPSSIASGSHVLSASALHTHQEHVFSANSYPHFAQAPVTPQGIGGTWWYVPAYPFYPPPQTDQPPDSEHHESPSSPSASPPDPRRHDEPLTYPPDSPADRSEWVMWVGNVPGDAVHEELWRCFTQPVGGGGSSTDDSSVANNGGVLSMFLISHSNCAFVSYETESHLHAAIVRFDGVSLRTDPQGARLACRVRRKDDDMRAGVSGQHGMGMHGRWVKAEKRKREKAARGDAEILFPPDAATISSPDSTRSLTANMSALSLDPSAVGDPRVGSAGPDPPPQRLHAESSNHNSNSNSSGSGSGSFASTTSSLLQQHFPQRFFILKSLTLDDLDRSARTGVWATQKHNESILDRAFRTSQDVFLIFSVNKSREFYGYARLAGPVGPVGGGRALNGDAGPAATRSEPGPSTFQHSSQRAFPTPLWPVEEAGETDAAGEQGTPVAESWGMDFRVHWICTQRLPFPRTRHIRNPWNQDREVKVSEDGTELAPSVGQALLDEWGLFLGAEVQVQTPMGNLKPMTIREEN
ncbi:YT521-B-like domain-containing protein [Mycena epipterygia]|nr:YT521-B-like domain-containing protein [Mycena epipterygia]